MTLQKTTPGPAHCVMVLGTTSGAGKSWLTTALCRWYARQGFKVAPFKAQNMSNNARVVAGPGGQPGEIGSAQYFQALAAGAEPEVRMNPLLLKPEADTRSQVVLLGQVDTALTEMPWRGRSEKVWPAIARTLAMQPKVILFDEPTSALDPEMVQEVLNVIRALADEGRTMLLVTHEMSFARQVSSEVVFLHQGLVEEQGSPAQVFDNPNSARCKQFMSSNR